MLCPLLGVFQLNLQLNSSGVLHLINQGPWYARSYRTCIAKNDLLIFGKIWSLTFFPLTWMPIFLPQTVPLECLQRVGPWRACANLSRTLWPHRLCRSTVSPWWPSLEVEILWRCLILLVQQSTFSPQDWRSRPMLIPTPWFEECSCIIQVRSANDVQLGLLPSCFSRTIFCPPCWLCLSPHTWARWGCDGSQRWSLIVPECCWIRLRFPCNWVQDVPLDQKLSWVIQANNSNFQFVNLNRKMTYSGLAFLKFVSRIIRSQQSISLSFRIQFQVQNLDGICCTFRPRLLQNYLDASSESFLFLCCSKSNQLWISASETFICSKFKAISYFLFRSNSFNSEMSLVRFLSICSTSVCVCSKQVSPCLERDIELSFSEW